MESVTKRNITQVETVLWRTCSEAPKSLEGVGGTFPNVAFLLVPLILH